MDALDWIHFGAPQIAALLILLQRGLEELYSKKNTKNLLAQGAKEHGAAYYPVVAVTHLGWIFGLFFLIPATAEISWPLLVAYLGLQGLRYWVIATLGPYWTHRIISIDTGPIVRKGPYRFVRHPNYLITFVETPLLPLCFGAYAYAVLLGAVWGAVLHYKIRLEDQALQARRSGGHDAD